MIFVIAPGTGELVSRRLVARMRLPLRTGWDGWIYKDKRTGKSLQFRSYRRLKNYLRSLN